MENTEAGQGVATERVNWSRRIRWRLFRTVVSPLSPFVSFIIQCCLHLALSNGVFLGSDIQCTLYGFVNQAFLLLANSVSLFGIYKLYRASVAANLSIDFLSWWRFILIGSFIGVMFAINLASMVTYYRRRAELAQSA